MLVLTRKLNEEIVIDGDITLTVLQIKGNRIRLGIKAPQCTSIRRAELQILPTGDSNEAEPECEPECEPPAAVAC